jgi:hypothetical protein
MGGALASALTPASVGLGSLGGGAAAGGALSAIPAAAPALANTGGGLLNSSILAPQPVAQGATQIAANPINSLSSGPAIHNPFGLGAADAPTWGQRTFGNNAIGQGIDETIAMVDPRVSSPQLADARMGVLKSFAGDQLKSGVKDQMNFSPAPAMPQRQAPQQQQGNNVNPYTVNSLNRLNRRLNPLGGGF